MEIGERLLAIHSGSSLDQCTLGNRRCFHHLIETSVRPMAQCLRSSSTRALRSGVREFRHAPSLILTALEYRYSKSNSQALAIEMSCAIQDMHLPNMTFPTEKKHAQEVLLDCRSSDPCLGSTLSRVESQISLSSAQLSPHLQQVVTRVALQMHNSLDQQDSVHGDVICLGSLRIHTCSRT